jgi:hypothetical protein
MVNTERPRPLEPGEKGTEEDCDAKEELAAFLGRRKPSWEHR